MKSLVILLFALIRPLMGQDISEIAKINQMEFESMWVCYNPVFTKYLQIEQKEMIGIDAEGSKLFKRGLSSGGIEIVKCGQALLNGETWIFFQKNGVFLDAALRVRLDRLDINDFVCFDVIFGKGYENKFSPSTFVKAHGYGLRGEKISFERRAFVFKGLNVSIFKNIPKLIPLQADPEYISL